MSQHDWFVGNMDRDAAVQFLTSQPRRSFVVRLNQKGQHCVTARLAGGESFVHTLLEQRADDGAFIVMRTDGAPIVAGSVQEALEQLGYLEPVSEDLYAPAAPASALHNHYVALPLSPPAKIAAAAPPAAQQTNVYFYLPVPNEAEIATRNAVTATTSATSASKGSGVKTTKSDGSGVKATKSSGSGVKTTNSSGSGVKVGTAAPAPGGVAVSLFRPPTTPAQAPTQHYLPTQKVIVVPVAQVATGDDSAGEKKKKKHRHRHRSTKNKADGDGDPES